MKIFRVIIILIIITIAFCSCGKKYKKTEEDIFYGKDYENETISQKDLFIIEEKRVLTDSYQLQIPDGYNAIDNGNSLIIENENDNIDINIEEQVFGESNINQYLAETIDKYRQMGAEVSQPEIVTINNIEMQRFKLVFIQMNALEYVVDLGDKAILISIVSNDDIPVDVVDMLIEDLKIIIN